MSSRRHIRNIVLASVFATALAGLGVSLSSAATTTGRTGNIAQASTWTVSPGGSDSAIANAISLKDLKTGNSITCTSSTASGTLKSGSGLPGTGIGSASSASFNSCDGPDGIVIETRIIIWPLGINAVSYNPVTRVTTGAITGIHMTASAPTCNFVVDGTSPTADNGSVTGTYANSTGLGAATGGNLHVYNASCLGLFNTGDSLQVGGTYMATTRQNVTSP